MYGLLATLYGPTARFAIRKTYRNRIVAYMDYCSMSLLDKPPQIIILTRVSFRSFVVPTSVVIYLHFGLV